MCEPYHSIVQYGNHDDDDNISPQSGNYIIGKLGDFAKKVKGFFHISKLGGGHSRAIGNITGNALLAYESDFTLFETAWWNRTTHLDSGKITNHDQMTAAKEYSNLVSIGDLRQLRNFLETSMKKSDRPELYAHRFFDGILTEKGKVAFETKFKHSFKRKTRFTNIDAESLIKFVIGFTRKRNLLIPEWSDDNKLWI